MNKTVDEFIIEQDKGCISIRFYSHRCIRLDYFETNRPNYNKLWDDAQPIPYSDYIIQEDTKSVEIKVNTSKNKVVANYDKESKHITFNYDKQKIVLSTYDLIEKKIGEDIVTGGLLKCSVEEGEAYYGLGQQQSNLLDYAGHKIEVFHNYKAKGGETIGIPILYSSNKYGIIFNSPAQTCVDLTNSGEIVWENDCTKDLSVILFFGDTMQELYVEVQHIVGKIPMPLKASLGYIQCKQRYESQEELLEVARKYREKKYPIDMMVVDWFYWEHLGDMDLWEKDWPDAKAMTQELTAMDMDCMISVWPRFMKESLHYDYIESKGYLVKDREGETVYGTPDDQRGALIDTTNPEAAKWYWETIYENLAKKGFVAWWTDENEPDLWPYDFKFHEGLGYEVFNCYPYMHTKCIYEGHREKLDTRACILSRSAFLGSQKHGTQFWSSDIYPTWGVLAKQIPAAINFCATGMGYWSSDIGGWQTLPDYDGRSQFRAAELVLETQGSTEGIVLTRDYPELYVRWFQFGVFSPIFRAHGTRDENEVWSYGEEVEKILVKFLKLRYTLMPYIYTMAYKVSEQNKPILRGLFIDYDDPECRDCKESYMFGDSLLVSPIVQKGQTKKVVYLPKGDMWYNYWTNERYEGGKSIEVEAPLDQIPLFIKANTILPIAHNLQSTKDEIQSIQLKMYGVHQGTFTLYEDDGRTYKYEEGDQKITTITYDGRTLSVSGDRKADSFSIEVIN